jgi:hypothetical protein
MKATWSSNTRDGIAQAREITMEVEVLQWSPDRKKAEIQYQTASGAVKRRWVDAKRIVTM